MSDLFHPHVPESFIGAIFDVVTAAKWHVFQVLTKRPERMASFLQDCRLPAHIWVGTSVENPRHGVPRIAELRKVKAATRFLSVEPLLEDIGKINLRGIAWVIVGGESGRGAQSMDAEWARGVREQCVKAGTRFFFKQWGAHGLDGVRRSRKANGRIVDGRVWNDMPYVSRAFAIASR